MTGVNMKIEVSEINNIKKDMRFPYHRGLQVDINVTERQQEDIIRQIWENIGDEDFFKIIEQEGYSIKKLNLNKKKAPNKH